LKKSKIFHQFISNWVSSLFAFGILFAVAACGSSSTTPEPDSNPAPINSAPVISSTAVTSVEELQDYSYTLTATDADGDALTMSSATMSDWLAFDTATGVLSGTPTTTDVGDHAVTLSVSDGTVQTDQVFTISVTAAPNNAPEITSSAVLTATDGEAYSYTLTATDADGDTLTMSSANTPAWLSFDDSTGILSGTPATTDVGEHAVTLSVSDGTDQTDQSFTIAVAIAPNNVPVITSAGILTATDAVAYSYTLTATDADGDTLTMSSMNTPAWLSFDESTGILSGTPATADVGDHIVALSVTDGTDQVDQDFTISVMAATTTNSLVIFDDAQRADWPAWDCCGGSTPMEVTDADATYGAAMEFSIGIDATVMGFTARDADGAVGGTPFDASAMADEGTLVFDLKMTASPGDTAWKLKIESNNAASFVEVDLSTSEEAHAAPVMDTWQRYTFNLADLSASGLDLSAIDVVLVFPAWGAGDGAVYRLDNVQILPDGNAGNGGGGDIDPLVVFNDAERADWPAWDCCGGSTPIEVTDADATYGATMEFSIGIDATVMGFTSRDADGAVGGTPFDASAMADEGTLVFDLKMTASPGDTAWKLKLESNNAATFVEVDLSTSQEAHAAPVMDTWQRYTFNLADLSASGLDLTAIDVVLVFPAWGAGDGAVYRLDNVQVLQDGNAGGGGVNNGTQIDLPINFDDAGVDYTVEDFGGNATVLVADPVDAANGMVAQSTKTSTAETWAGTTMSTGDGLATAVPLTLSDSIMKVWVYSPDAGIPVRLKMEDRLDPTRSVETESMTTTANSWEQISFDFANEATGTAALDPSYTFDKASIFFNFGTDGATAGEKVYYWDDITFGQ